MLGLSELKSTHNNILFISLNKNKLLILGTFQ